ncbi:amino acid/amide ABC transporter ATP-binding protein 2 (HAAT family) [Rhodobacter aestuarii]|uniref:Amino acid/amide ABC transporter ATP-binding protein 2, HAAT family n=1 Tax=Rhodobacter aestuarii TaxID=453582 RepID=A0A1N7L2A0_9RHOB|nr:urea ABC transporter ATP-binding subunit UrtE [Rhodobacter aestuarii]PTV95425.1 amino acid/amide ABC transporter ATP-binding protein 2 (HAAT family) [Rhodobacter aestuarii]SIS67992.1 amino acid/amide ABC transporter ATP-binding protein 2, HAAT family [Rhodobacter aestuarii]
MLKTEGLTLHYGGSQILYGIDLEARAGEVTCIMGTNGVGKTSLLKAIAGAHPRSGGSVTLDGQTVGKVPPQAMARRGLGYVPQGRMIFPLLTVRENMETAFAVLPRSERFIPDEIYELFPILKEFLNRRGGDLSGGQQQQLAIARAMLMKPKLLLLDEPTEGIQPNIIQQIGRVIKYLRDTKGMAIVLVEQYFDFAHDLGDRFYVLKRGAVAMEGTKESLSREALREVVSV